MRVKEFYSWHSSLFTRCYEKVFGIPFIHNSKLKDESFSIMEGELWKRESSTLHG